MRAPLIERSKREIVLRGLELGVDFGLTHTCYTPVAKDAAWLACGRCDACVLRLEGYRQAGARDPVAYVPGVDR